MENEVILDELKLVLLIKIAKETNAAVLQDRWERSDKKTYAMRVERCL